MAPETLYSTICRTYCDSDTTCTTKEKPLFAKHQRPSPALSHDALEICLLPQSSPALLQTAAERIAAATKWQAITRQWTFKFNQLFTVYKRAAVLLGERARLAYQALFDRLQTLVARLMGTFDALHTLQNTELLPNLTQNQVHQAMRLCLETGNFVTARIATLRTQVDSCERERVTILNKMLCAFIECIRPYNKLNSTIGDVDSFRDRQAMMFDQTLLCNQRAIASFFHHIELCMVRFKIQTHVLSRTIVHEWKSTKFTLLVKDFLSSSSISADTVFVVQFGQNLTALTHSYKVEVIDACHDMLAMLPDLVSQARTSLEIDAIVSWWRRAFAVTHTRAQKLLFDGFLVPVRSNITMQLAEREQALISLQNSVVSHQIYTTDELYDVQRNRFMLDECVHCIGKRRLQLETTYETLEAALSAMLRRNMLRMRAAFTFAYATVQTWHSYLHALHVAHQSLQLHLQLVQNEFVSKYYMVMLALDFALDRMQHARSSRSLQKRKQHALKAAENIVRLYRSLFERKISILMNFYPRIVERQSRIYLERLCRIFQLCMPWWWRVRRIVTKPDRRNSAETDLIDESAARQETPDNENEESNAELRDFAVFVRQQNLIDNNDTELFTGVAGSLHHDIGQMLAESELLADWAENQTDDDDEKCLANVETASKNNFLQDVTDLLQQHHAICRPLYPEKEAKTEFWNQRRPANNTRSSIEASDSATKLTPLDEERWHVGSVQNLTAVRDEEEDFDTFLEDIANLFSMNNISGGRSKKSNKSQLKQKVRDAYAASKATDVDSGADSDSSKASHGTVDDGRHLSLPSPATRNAASLRGQWAAHATRSFESLEIILHSAAPNVLRLRKRYGILMDFATIISLRDQTNAARRRTLLSRNESATSRSSPIGSRSTSRMRQRVQSNQRVMSANPLSRDEEAANEQQISTTRRNFSTPTNLSDGETNPQKSHSHSPPKVDTDDENFDVKNKDKTSKSTVDLASEFGNRKTKKGKKLSRQQELPLLSSDDEVKKLSTVPWNAQWEAELSVDSNNKSEKTSVEETFYALLLALKKPDNVDMLFEIERETDSSFQSLTPKLDLLDSRSRAYYATIAATSVDILENCSVIVSRDDDDGKSQDTDKIFFPNERRLHQVRHFERWRARNGGGRYDPADKNLVRQIWSIVSSSFQLKQMLTSANDVANHFLIDNRKIESVQHNISEKVLQDFLTDWWPNTVKQAAHQFVALWKQHIYQQMTQMHGQHWLKYQLALIDHVFANRMHFIKQHDILRKLYVGKVNRCTSVAKQNVLTTVDQLQKRIDEIQFSITQGEIFERATGPMCQHILSLNELLQHTHKSIESCRTQTQRETKTLARKIRSTTTSSVVALNFHLLSELRTFSNGKHFTVKEIIDIGRFLSSTEDKTVAIEALLQKDVANAGDRLAQYLKNIERICKDQFQQFEHDLGMTVLAKHTLRRMQYAVRSEARRLKESFERIQDLQTDCNKQMFDLAKLSSDPLKLVKIENETDSLTGIVQIDNVVRTLASLCKQVQNVAEFTESKQKEEEELPNVLQHGSTDATCLRPMSAPVKGATKSSPELSTLASQTNRPQSANVIDKHHSTDAVEVSLNASPKSKPHVGMAFIAQLSMLAIPNKHPSRRSKSRRPSKEPRPSASTANNTKSHAGSLDKQRNKLRGKISQMQLANRGAELAFKNARCALLGLPPVVASLVEELTPQTLTEVVIPNNLGRKTSTAGSHSRFPNPNSKIAVSKRWSETRNNRSASPFAKRNVFKQSLTTLVEEKEGRSSLGGSIGLHRNRLPLLEEEPDKKLTEDEIAEHQREAEVQNNKNLEAASKLASISTNEDPLRNIPKRIIVPKSEQYDISERVQEILRPPSAAAANPHLQNPKKRQNTSGSVLEKYFVLGEDEPTTQAVVLEDAEADLEKKRSKKVVRSASLSRPASKVSKLPMSIMRLNVIQEQQSNAKIAVPARERRISSSESDENADECNKARQPIGSLSKTVLRPDSAPAVLSPEQHGDKPWKSYRETVMSILRHHYNKLLQTFSSFYDVKTAKKQAILRSNDIAPNFEECATTYVKLIQSYVEQSNKFHEDCVNLLLDEAKNCEILMCRAPNPILNSVSIVYSAHINARIDVMLLELRAQVRDLLASRRRRRQELTTSLGHPSNKYLLDRISKEELQSNAFIRQVIHRQISAIWQTHLQLLSLFFGSIQKTAHYLLEFCADKLVCADDIVTYWGSPIAEQQVFWKFLENSVDKSQTHPTALIEKLRTRRVMSCPRITLHVPPLRASLSLSSDKLDESFKARRLESQAGLALSDNAPQFMRRKYQFAEEREIKLEDEEERLKFKVKTTEFEKVFETDEQLEDNEIEADNNKTWSFTCFRGFRTSVHTNLGHVAIFLAVLSVVQQEKLAVIERARKTRHDRRLLLDAALQEELLWEDDLVKINEIFKVAEILQNI